MKTLKFKDKATLSNIQDGIKSEGYENISKAKSQLESACKKYGRLVKELETFTDFLEIQGATKYKPIEEFSRVNNKALEEIRRALVKLSQSTKSMS